MRLSRLAVAPMMACSPKPLPLVSVVTKMSSTTTRTAPGVREGRAGAGRNFQEGRTVIDRSAGPTLAQTAAYCDVRVRSRFCLVLEYEGGGGGALPAGPVVARRCPSAPRPRPSPGPKARALDDDVEQVALLVA